MNHFEIILNGTHNVYSKKRYENNILFIKRCWVMATTGCSETLSRSWVGWKFYGNIYNDELMNKLEQIDVLLDPKK